MQQMMVYWESIVPQHDSGVFTPVIRRAVCSPYDGRKDARIMLRKNWFPINHH